MTKHDAMLAYLRDSPLFEDIAFQFGKIENEAVIFNTETNDATVTTDITGRKTKQYTYAITTYRPYSTDAESALNTDVINAVESLMLWIDEQDKARNYPDFDNCVVKKIENLQNAPSVAGIDDKKNLVKYMCQMRVTYTTNE